jgi:hypothetical protein
MSPLDVVILAKRPSPSAESPEVCLAPEFPDEVPPEAFCPVQAENDKKRTQRPAKIGQWIKNFFSKFRMGNLIIFGIKGQFERSEQLIIALPLQGQKLYSVPVNAHQFLFCGMDHQIHEFKGNSALNGFYAGSIPIQTKFLLIKTAPKGGVLNQRT